MPGHTEKGETAVYQNLHPPIHIIPRFESGHAQLAKQLGLVLGPLAHVSTDRSRRRIENFLVQVPEGWSQIGDTGVSEGEKNGTYFVDEKNRRRIRFGDMNNWYSAKAEVLCRYAIQEWMVSMDETLWYVRKIVGGEGSIHRYPHRYAHVVFEIRIRSNGFDVEARQTCEGWLDEHFPDWQNPLAYWDD